MVWLVALAGCGSLAAYNAGDSVIEGCRDACAGVATTTRYARLTHLQWENTVQDLLGLPGPTGLSETFIGDTIREGFENDAELLQVTPELAQDYQRAAESLATTVVTDPAVYTVVVPQDRRTPGGTSFDARVEAEDPANDATTGAVIGDAYGLMSAGSLTARVTVPTAGAYTVDVRAWADQAGPAPAQMIVRVDGGVALDTEVTADGAGAAQTFAVPADLDAGEHELTVAFVNDYYDAGTGDDRNLYVDWVEVSGGGGALGVSTAGDDERDAWIASFGAKAHRRPLTAVEVATYVTLFDAGPELFATGDDFADGVRVVVSAMLQSPHFVYRVEASETADDDGRVPLSSWELASKLSYALWNTMPDGALRDAAASGDLVTTGGLRKQAKRLLDDPRAHDAIADFHRQLLDLDNYVNIEKDGGLYPEFGPTTAASMQAEASTFVDDVVFGGGGLHELLTAPRTFVNDDLAKIYGLSGAYGADLVPVDLDPAERAGLLTMPGFLALEGDAYVHSPIRRGAFVNDNIVCSALPPPPDNVPPLPASDGTMTTRERVDEHTGDGTCGAGCHSLLINPIGFAYERYDALGRYRTTEFGLPVDSADQFSFSAGPADYADAIDLAALLGDDVGVHACYVGHLVEYLGGRHLAEEDGGLVQWMGAVSLTSDLPIRDLIVELLLVDGFRFRSDEVQ